MLDPTTTTTTDTAAATLATSDGCGKLWWRAALCAVLVFVIIVRPAVRAHLRLRHIRGPFWAGWTDIWLIRSQLSGRMNFILADANREYGPIARIAPNWVVCGDASELRRIWGVRSAWRRAPWYRGLRIDPYRDSTFSTLDEDVHDALRAKLLPGYGGKDVDNLHGLIDEQVAGLVRLLEEKYLSSSSEEGVVVFRPVDLARKVQYFTLDVISSLAFGAPFGYLAADADKFGYIATTESTVPVLLATALVPWLLALLQSPRLRWLMPSAREMVGIGTVMGLAQAAVAERYDDNNAQDQASFQARGDHHPRERQQRRDMLGSFVAHGLSREDAEGETVVQIIAGSDTSATAIRSTLLFVMTNPHVYLRLRQEIDAGVAEGRISSPVADAEARGLPYLQAVIREGLRMWPPATGLLPKISSRDEVVCGVHVPAGTNVAWAPWSVMRDRSIFGEDADLFRPERWIVEGEGGSVSAERWRLMDQTVMLDFASGSRWECLGKNIAMIELNKVYVELLRRFDFTLIDLTRPWKSFNAAFFIQSDMNVRITRRERPV